MSSEIQCQKPYIKVNNLTISGNHYSYPQYTNSSGEATGLVGVCSGCPRWYITTDSLSLMSLEGKHL